MIVIAYEETGEMRSSSYLQDLLYRVAVAGHRHCGRAAEACKVSEPTLSSQIRKPEEELGVTLLECTSELVELAPAGARIPALAANSLRQRGIALRQAPGRSCRTIRPASRAGSPRSQALRALQKVFRMAVMYARSSDEK